MADVREEKVIIEQSLFEFAKQAEEEGLVDKRKKSWVTHKCSLILVMIIVGLLRKRLSIQSIARLYHEKATAQEMWDLFEPYFGEELKEHGFPSYSCIDRFLQTADTEGLALYLSEWGYQLVHDDGVKFRLWGVDGQAARSSKLVKDGGRPKYNVDYYDLESDIMVYMAGVESKSQESVVCHNTIQDVLSGHPNVILGADAMMAKKGILEEAQQVGVNTFMPIKRNNPILMNGFAKTIEDQTLAGSDAVDHYVDLNGMPDGVGCEVVRDTVCSYEEEDNKKYDKDLKSRPIREVLFFDDVYPYGKETANNGDSMEGQGNPLPLDPATKGKWFNLGGDRFVVMAPAHGRYERREYEVITDPIGCDIWENIPDSLKREWGHLTKSVAMVTRYRACPDSREVVVGKDKKREEYYKVTVSRTVCGYGFVPDSAESIANIMRGYWGIENKLHKVTDDILGQDQCTCRVGNSTANMSFMRKTAYNVLSGVKNAVLEVCDKAIGYIEVLEALSVRGDLACKLVFEEPTKACESYARYCYG